MISIIFHFNYGVNYRLRDVQKYERVSKYTYMYILH